MQAVRSYEWATEAVEKVTRQHRESQACERRLRQMQAKREKDAKRARCAQRKTALDEIVSRAHRIIDDNARHSKDSLFEKLSHEFKDAADEDIEHAIARAL